MKRITHRFRNCITLLGVLSASIISGCHAGSSANSATQTSHNLKITTPEDFSELPNDSDIAKLANATVGFMFLDENKKVNTCTGVAIADDLLLTANHCIVNHIDGAKFIKANGEIVLFLPYSENYIPIGVKDVYPAWDGTTAHQDGDDIGIIKFEHGTFKHSLKMDEIISGNNLDTLSDKIWHNQHQLYFMSWGSNKTFEQYNMPSIYTLDKKRFFSFPVDLHGLIYKDAKRIIDTYNKENLAITFDGGTSYTKNTSTPELASLTNLLLMPTDERGQPGDSGGPVFVCDGDDGNKCHLVGVYSGQHDMAFNSDKNDKNVKDFITTLTNPFYTQIKTAADVKI